MSIHNYTQDQQVEITELISGAALDALSDEDQALLELYLQNDPDLEFEVIRYLECTTSLAENVPQIDPPQSLRQSIQAIEPLSVSILQTRRKDSFSWQKLAIAVGCLITLLTGLNNLHLRQELQMAQVKLESLEGSETHLYSLKGTQPASTASGIVLLDFAAGRATVALQNLQPLQAGQIYQMWAVIGQKKVSCGQFKSDAVNRVVEAIPIPVEEYNESDDFTLIITMESSRHAVVPSSAVVMYAALEI